LFCIQTVQLRNMVHGNNNKYNTMNIDIKQNEIRL